MACWARVPVPAGLALRPLGAEAPVLASGERQGGAELQFPPPGQEKGQHLLVPGLGAKGDLARPVALRLLPLIQPHPEGVVKIDG